MEVDFARKKIELRNGETYAYRELGTSNTQTIILIHGAFASSSAFQHCFLQLSKNFHIFAIDLRGHGHSSYNQTLSSHDDFVTDLKQFTDALNLDKFYLLGWSMGGNVAMKFAAQYPDQTQGLLLINPASTKGFPTYKVDENGVQTTERAKTKEEVNSQPGPRFIAESVVKKDREGIRGSLNGFYFNGKNKPREEMIEILTDAWLEFRCADVLPWNSNKFNISDEHNGVNQGMNEISKIKCKILIVHGGMDLGVPVEEAKYIKEKLGDLVELIVLSDAGHFVLEDYPKETLDAIEKFCLKQGEDDKKK